MKLTRISASNLKGETFTHDLAEATAIIGPNFSGKTAIIEAIRLALMGYIPEVGKLPRATWELSSSLRMSVTAEFDTPGAITREFRLDRPGHSNTVTTSVDTKGVTLLSFETLPLLNAQAYFEMTDTERVNYVFSMIKLPESYTAEGIIAEIERLSFGEEHTELIEKAKAVAIGDARDCFKPEDERAGDPSKNAFVPTIQEALGMAVITFRERFSYWNRRAKETQGAVKTLTELKLREKECTADSIRQLDAELAEAQAELNKLNQQKGQLTAREDEAARNLGRKRQIQKILDDRVDYSFTLARFEGDIKEAEAKLVPVPAKEEWKALRITRDKVANSLVGVEATVRHVTKKISEIDNRLEGLDNLTACPFCKSKGKHWKENLEKELNDSFCDAISEQTEGRQMIEEERDSLVKLSKKIEQIEKDVIANDALRTQIANWRTEFGRYATEKEKEEKRRIELHEELARLNALPDQLNLETQLTENERKRAACLAIWRDRDAGRTAALNLQQDLKRAAQAQIEHQDANAHLTVIKAVSAVIKQKRADMIEEAFGGLLKSANAICGNILKSPLALHEGTIGRWESAKFIPHRVFSGMEKKLTYVAIAAALSVQAPLRLMLVDELGLATGNVQGMVMMNLKKTVKDGLLDQVIVVIPSDVKIDIPGWQVIWID